MSTLNDLDPKPQGGEWYSVLLDGISSGTRSGIRVVVVIDKNLPNMVEFSDNLYTMISNCKDPILLRKDEAEKNIAKEIEDLELLVSVKEVSFTATLVRLMHDFKKKHFG